MIRHTPGPWTVHWNAPDSAEIHGPDYEIALVNGYVEEAELRKNAYLIAALPNMLITLRTLANYPALSRLSPIDALDDMRRIAREALKGAKND